MKWLEIGLVLGIVVAMLKAGGRYAMASEVWAVDKRVDDLEKRVEALEQKAVGVSLKDGE